MNAPGLLVDMQLSYNQFTKTEKKIADFVGKHANQVLFMSITDLAEACNVADASVHRFCRTLGLKGYQEFKMKLSLSMSTEETLAREPGEANLKVDSMECTLDTTLENHVRVLQETRRLQRPDDLERAVRLMEEARQIYFFGIGDSLLTAKEARNKFLRITNNVSCVEDPHMQAMTASMATPEDLIFFISYSGATKDNVYVANIAREVGARIVTITRFVKSPLSVYADINLLCGSNEGPLEGGSMAAKMSQLYVIDILFREFYKRNCAKAAENNRKTSKAVVDKLY